MELYKGSNYKNIWFYHFKLKLVDNRGADENIQFVLLADIDLNIDVALIKKGLFYYHPHKQSNKAQNHNLR